MFPKKRRKWDRARAIWNRALPRPQGNRELKKSINDIRAVNSHPNVLYKALMTSIDYLTVVMNHKLEYEILILIHNVGTPNIDLDYFRHRSLTEIWVFFCKVKKDSHLNELLIDEIKEIMKNRTPEIVFVAQ